MKNMETFLTKNFKFCPKCKVKLDLKSSFASCSKCDFIYYFNPAPCVVALFYKDNKTLLAKRAIEPQKNTWDTIGGFIENGETAEQTVVREVKEETNLEVKVKKYLGSVPDIYGDTLVPTLIFVYLVEINGGEMKAQDDVAQLEWFEIDKLPKNIAFASFGPIIKMLKKHIKE